MRLRPYQSQASDAIFKEWEGVDSTCVVMPTGTGKTILFSDVIRRVYPKRSIVIAHREELIWQARDKIRAYTGLRVDVEMGNHKSAGANELFERAPVVVATIQTLIAGGDGTGRIGKFDPDEFGCVVADECHHFTADSYRRAFEYFRTNSKMKFVGVTATPDRADEEALGQIFDTVAFDYEIEDAIHDGWLVPVDQFSVAVSGLDFSNIRTTAGDLNQSDLDAVMKAEKPAQQIIQATFETMFSLPEGHLKNTPIERWKDYATARPKRTLGFSPSVNLASYTSNIFNRIIPGMSAFVHAKTDRDDRKRILLDYRKNKILCVWNCGIFTEGFDDDGVELVVLKPTKSRALCAQMIGRSLRPLEGTVDGPFPKLIRKYRIRQSAKPCATILDFYGITGKHKLITPADILGGNFSEETIREVNLLARKSGKPVRVSELLDEEEEKQKKQREEKRLAEEARKARLVAKADYKKRAVDPFNLLDIKPVVSRGWDKGKEFTEGQRASLRRNGIDPEEIEYAQGKQLLGALAERVRLRLCSLGQMKLLKKYYIPTDKVTFEHAGRIITAIRENGWRKPAHLPPPIASDSQSAANQAQRTAGSVHAEDDNVPF